MQIFQLNNCNKIKNRCTKKDKEENNKKCNMQEKSKGKRNNEENRETRMLKIN